MNRNFLRPLLIIGLAAVITGIVELLIPAWDNSFIPIKKMPWFSALLSHNAAGDSVSVDTGLIEHIPSALDPFTKNLAMLQPLSGQQPLVSSTKPGRKKNLRVAYYSDSTIEGDLITAPLRHSFQSVYGGSGVGMVPITSIVAGFRQTIRHSFSKNWESISFMSSARKDMSWGSRATHLSPVPITQRNVRWNSLIPLPLLQILWPWQRQIYPSQKSQRPNGSMWITILGWNTKPPL
jgi:hypothetical protein